ncbi:Protein R05G6.5 [Aphelenchoides avenae]|nr:Protein R05G6.5 [Aphelenchus avenae]
MYRKIYCSPSAHKCADCLQTVVLAVPPSYAEYLEDLVDDLIGARFGILMKKEKNMTDDEVYNWFLDADSEEAAQFTNGTSTFFLLAKQNAIIAGQELAKFHNGLSIAKSGKKAVYVSSNVVSAMRDVQLHFPEYAARQKKDIVQQTRNYASTHLVQPISEHLAEMKLKRHPRQLLRADMAFF